MTYKKIGLLLLMIALFRIGYSKMSEKIIGKIRIQPLSQNLVRIEQKGPQGFEDRETFSIKNRDWKGVVYDVEEVNSNVVVRTDKYSVVVPENCSSITEVEVKTNNKSIYNFTEPTHEALLELPDPAEKIDGYAIWDTPRIIPPKWGATPAPENMKNSKNSGWDLSNDAPDVYVFIPGKGGYEKLRHDFLKLTGPIELPPLYSFGVWDSRYHAYTEESALKTIDKYRKKDIPLDVFVVDTDWRVGASVGYQVDEELFPDMERFIKRAHKRNVKLMYNDHPEPEGPAISAKEMQFRWDGLTSLLEMGIDLWWFDRNWHTSLKEPAPGLNKEVWGMAVYHDITKKFRPERRPLIMSNCYGITGGRRTKDSHISAHRYPIWWTGDTGPQWKYLKLGIENGVEGGVNYLLPYINEDLGGHFVVRNKEDYPELFIRFAQYGSLSPVTRFHCTKGAIRYPWAWGEKAEKIIKKYLQLRLRMLPVYYSAAREAYESGSPILKRCDLLWPEHEEAQSNLQYILGKDILVAPVHESKYGSPGNIPSELLRTPDGEKGLLGKYYDNAKLEGDPKVIKPDKKIDFNWGNGSPNEKIGSDNFSVEWCGKIGPIPENGEYTFFTETDDGVRLWIEGEKVIDKWVQQAPTTYDHIITLEKDKTYRIRLQYFEKGGGAVARLQWQKPKKKYEVKQNVWIPPGEWRELWTGEVVSGPQNITVTPELWHTPMWVRNGGMIFTLPQMKYTGEKKWNKIIADVYLGEEDYDITRTIYEDDGISKDYKKGAFAKTNIQFKKEADKVKIKISPIQGNYDGMIENRKWVFRIHPTSNLQINEIMIDNRKITKPNLVEPGNEKYSIPFPGENKPPAPGEPTLIELKLDSKPTSQSRAIQFNCSKK
jgi:alpha-glucosidase (family GH31 glycosyl hydrolase)